MVSGSCPAADTGRWSACAPHCAAGGGPCSLSPGTDISSGVGQMPLKQNKDIYIKPVSRGKIFANKVICPALAVRAPYLPVRKCFRPQEHVHAAVQESTGCVWPHFPTYLLSDPLQKSAHLWVNVICTSAQQETMMTAELLGYELMRSPCIS